MTVFAVGSRFLRIVEQKGPKWRSSSSCTTMTTTTSGPTILFRKGWSPTRSTEAFFPGLDENMDLVPDSDQNLNGQPDWTETHSVLRRRAPRIHLWHRLQQQRGGRLSGKRPASGLSLSPGPQGLAHFRSQGWAGQFRRMDFFRYLPNGGARGRQRGQRHLWPLRNMGTVLLFWET